MSVLAKELIEEDFAFVGDVLFFVEVEVQHSQSLCILLIARFKRRNVIIETFHLHLYDY